MTIKIQDTEYTFTVEGPDKKGMVRVVCQYGDQQCSFAVLQKDRKDPKQAARILDRFEDPATQAELKPHLAELAKLIKG